MRSADTSLAILTYNEEANIGRALTSVLSGSALPKEILVIDNGSTDRTRLIVEAIREANIQPPIRWIDSGSNNLGQARGLAVAEASGAWIAFMDADCEAPRDWFSRMVEAFSFYRIRFPEVAGIGGEACPPKEQHKFYEALLGLRKSFLGHLNSPQARPIKRDIEVEHLPTTNCIFDRRLVREAGNFSEAFDRVCEDVELSLRLRAMGFRFLLVQGAGLIHHSGTSWEAWVERIYRFGWGQMMVASHHPKHIGLRLSLPILFLCTFSAAIFFSIWYPYLLFFPLSYFLFVSLVALRIRADIFPRLTVLMILTHFSYAAGELVGLITFRRIIRG